MSGARGGRDGAVGVVTGASRGFGQEVARTLAVNGWNVVTVSRHRSPELDMVTSVTHIQGDIATMDLTELLRAIDARPVDLLVNNAGVGGTGMQLAALASEEMERAFSVNVLGPARVAGAPLPHLMRSEHFPW